MSIKTLMEIYQIIFHPIILLLGILFLSIFLGSSNKFSPKKQFYILLLSLTPGAFFVLVFIFFLPKTEVIKDVALSLAILIFSLFTMYLYKLNKLNKTIFSYSEIIFLATIPYLVISPFWNISGHVLYSTIPILFLISKAWNTYFLFLIPIIMVFNRPIVGEHTWIQSILTFVFAIFLFFTWNKVRGSKRGNKLSKGRKNNK